MAQTLQLNKKELANLILEVYKDLTDENFVWNSMKKAKFNKWQKLHEQAGIDYSDGTVYLDPKLSMQANMDSLSHLQKDMKNRVETVEKKYSTSVATVKSQKSDNPPWYLDKHVWADILAAILYIAGAVTSVAGVGLILISAAIIVDLVNAYWYYEEENYFMAGLQASFILIPGINLAYVKAVPGFKTGLKKIAAVANKAFATGGVPSMKQLFKKLGAETTEAIAKQVRKHPRILSTAKSALSKIDKLIKSFDKFIKWLVKTNKDWLYDYLIPDWVIASVKGMRTVIKILRQTLFLVIAVFVELSIYDPSTAANVLGLGELIGLDFSSAQDWFMKQPKYGLDLWNGVLKYFGNAKGVMTTTPYDCRGTVYTWDEIVTAFKAEEKYANRDSASERRIWEKWTEDGWRPKSVAGDVGASTYWSIQQLIKTFPALEQELKDIDATIMENCYEFNKAFMSEEDTQAKKNSITIIDMATKKLLGE